MSRLNDPRRNLTDCIVDIALGCEHVANGLRNLAKYVNSRWPERDDTAVLDREVTGRTCRTCGAPILTVGREHCDDCSRL